MIAGLALVLGVSLAAPMHECSDCATPHLVEAAIARVDETEKEKAEKEKKRHETDIKSDIEMGAKYAAEVDKELKQSEDIAMIERVNRVGNELAEIANSEPANVSWGDPRFSKFTYSFKLVKGDDINAFSIPGGYIYVYEGLVKFAESDSELAGVMAHEIAHASFRHVAWLRKQSRTMDLLQLPLILLTLFGGGSDAGSAAQAITLASQSFKSGWSTKAETASDYGAIQYMVKSKYDPVGVFTLMERLGYRQRSFPKIDWGVYQTHPPSEERAEAILKHLKAFNVPVQRSRVSTSVSVKSKLADDGAIELWWNDIRIHGFRGDDAIARSEQAQERLNDFFDSSPALFEVAQSDGLLRGSGKRLFTVDAADFLNSEDPIMQAKEVVNRIRSAVYDLSVRTYRSAGMPQDQFFLRLESADSAAAVTRAATSLP